MMLHDDTSSAQRSLAGRDGRRAGSMRQKNPRARRVARGISTTGFLL